MFDFRSRADAKRKAVTDPADPLALMGASWPPSTFKELATLPGTIKRSATLPGTVDPQYLLWRVTEAVRHIKGRMARYGNVETWTIRSPNGVPVQFPLGDPNAVAFKKMADEYTPYYEKALVDFVVVRLGPGDVFVDIGAHVGYVGAFAATTGAAVFAIEVQRDLIPLIEQVASINAFELMRAMHVGASSAPGLCMISRTSGQPGFYLEGQLTRFIQDEPSSVIDDFVPLITLDSLFARDRLVPTLIKVDVEGHEIDVLMGATDLIEQARTTFVVEFHPHLVGIYNRSGDDLTRFFAADRWQWHQLTDAGLRPITGMADVEPDPRDPNPKLVFTPK